MALLPHCRSRFALLSHGKGQQSIAKMFLRTILRRVPQPADNNFWSIPDSSLDELLLCVFFSFGTPNPV